MTESTALTIQQLLAKHSPMPFSLSVEKDIIASSVTQWHKLGQFTEYLGMKGYVAGLRQVENTWENFRDYLSNIDDFSVEEVENWEGDLRDVTGLTSSSYSVRGFDCLDRFVEHKHPQLLKCISEAGLSEALAHPDLQPLMSGECVFTLYGWDGRVLLEADIGLQQLAAARYIAGKLNKKVPIKGSIKSHHMSYKAVRGLCEDFDLYAVKKSFDLEIDFFRAMRALKASYYHIELPDPLLGKAILLPKDDPQSMAASALLKQAGVTNLGLHLMALSSDQAFAPNT
jgi:hypothetical protein